ncbi:MAG: hypothetical protein ACRDG4_10565, partial [Chloroflexota bacterium]
PDRVLLREIDTVAVETDDRCVYAQQDVPITITLRVFSKGQPAQQPTTIVLEQWRDYTYVPPIDHGVPLAGDRPVMAGTRFTFVRVEQDDMALAIPSSITVPAGGVARLTITPRGATSPGCYKIRFIPPGARADPPADFLRPAFDPTIDFFTNLRVLPADDYSRLEDGQITWQLIYSEVFSYYALIYPIMSTIIPWGPDDAPNDVEHLRQYATLIRRVVDETNIASPMYMPITRELSAGKRALVRRWCDLQMRPARDL